MKIIELQNISFSYSEEERPIFTDFSFSIEEGKCLTIEGDNGTGKTTLFRIINGLTFPQSGKYLFNGLEINENYLKNNQNEKSFHKQIGYLFQNPDVMLFNATVYDEIAFGPRQMGLSDIEVKKIVDDCLNMFDLKELALKAPYHLSGGQKKKVALASIVSLNPNVYVLDEPFAGLDKKSQDKLISFLSELKKANKTILIATHNPIVKELVADDFIVLNED